MTSPATVAHYQAVERDAQMERLIADKNELRLALRNAIAYIQIENSPSGKKAAALLFNVLELTR